MSNPQIDQSKKKVIVGVSFCVLLLALIGMAILPNFINPIPLSHANVCINNLRDIEQAKWQWFLEKNRSTNDTPTWDDIKPYFKRDTIFCRFDPTNNLPVCPEGGQYTIGKVCESPTCSIGTNFTPGHFLP